MEEARITISQAELLTGKRRQQLKRYWQTGRLTPPIRRGRQSLLLRAEVEALAAASPLRAEHLSVYTVSKHEFARRRQCSPETIHNRYREHGRLVRGVRTSLIAMARRRRHRRYVSRLLPSISGRLSEPTPLQGNPRVELGEIVGQKGYQL